MCDVVDDPVEPFMGHFVMVYIVNACGYNKTWALQKLNHIEKSFAVCYKEICCRIQQSVQQRKYLVHVLGAIGVHAHEEKMQDMKNQPIRSCILELLNYAGLENIFKKVCTRDFLCCMTPKIDWHAKKECNVHLDEVQ